MSKTFLFSHLGDGYLSRLSTGKPVERGHRGVANHPVGRQADVLLEVTSSSLRAGSEDAVHPSGIESKTTEPPL